MEKKGIATEKGELNRSIQKTNRLIREIRAQICKVGRLRRLLWGGFPRFEQVGNPFLELPNLRPDLSVQREKSRKYSQSWQHQHAADELKTIAAAVNYLSCSHSAIGKVFVPFGRFAWR